MSDIKITDEEVDRLNEEYDKEKIKPKYLEAWYTNTIEWDIVEEEIDWGNVEDYWIKWGILHVIYKDGSSSEHQGATGDPDYKWADEVKVLNSDWEVLDE